MTLRIGDVDACAHCARRLMKYKGRNVYVRKRGDLDVSRLLRRKRAGLSVSELSEEFDRTPRHIYRLLRQQALAA